MNQKIIYDFKVSKSVCQNLDEIAENIKINIVKKSDADQSLFLRAIDCDCANDFLVKYRLVISNYDLLRNRLICESEKLDRISRHMFLIEQEAKKLAFEDER